MYIMDIYIYIYIFMDIYIYIYYGNLLWAAFSAHFAEEL